MLIFMALYVLAPSLNKRDTIEFGKPNCNPLEANGPAFIIYPEVNILTCINNLGPNNKPKMLKVGLKFFLKRFPSVKGA
jgi:hypothetical protein